MDAGQKPLFIPSLIGFAVIAGGLEPSIKKYADHIDCIRRMKQITMVCFQYAERTGEYPDSLETLLRLELLDEKTLACPGNPWHNPGENDYLYHGAGQHRDTVPGNMILLEDKPANHPEERFRSRLPASMF